MCRELSDDFLVYHKFHDLNRQGDFLLRLELYISSSNL